MKAEFRDPAGQGVKEQLAEDLGIEVDDIRTVDVYTVHAELDAEELERVRAELFTDPVIQESAIDASIARGYDYLIEVGFLPGVTDNVGRSSKEGIEDVLGRRLHDDEKVFKSTQYAVRGGVDRDICDRIVRDLIANALIQRWEIRSAAEMSENGHRLLSLPIVTERSDTQVHAVDLQRPDESLIALSRDMMLALDLAEMQAIRDYYRRMDVQRSRASLGLSREPTDIELEILAQTWSEHCKHKIFNAEIEYTDEHGNTRTIDGLFKTFVKGTTDAMARKIDWLVSVFDDNAGIIRFDDAWNFALKAETHNSPSALDPYGGAITGIVGVNRDILGAGIGCKCIFNTDVFCVGPWDYAGEIPPRLFHPRRVLKGVHRGVRDGGNESGIPNVNGAIVFHERFLGKPLVFCGTGGLIPRRMNGRPSELKKAHPGDVIVMCGGRIGKDGIHGATFSSEELHAGSPATAVQIGDPITQKKMADFLIEARDRDLFTNITDNGAGGLSSSIGEMARGPGGASVHLDRAPLKYAGLAPWEIFVSEAQERMTLSVPGEKLEELLALARRREVEATALGEFTDSGLLECWYDGQLIGALEMAFLHDGVPKMRLRAQLDAVEPVRTPLPEPDDYGQALLNVLSTYNTCSKESFVRMYDHEVQGQSVLKQFQGARQDGPGDAAVLRPVPGSNRGIAVACGIAPKYSDLDCYAMMASAIDEAVRNLVCVGARIGTIAGLDNFCWPDPVESEKTPDGAHKLAQLVRTCEALYDVCIAYDVPLISGKDSMKNDYKIGATKISIPPTVLFTAAAVVEDVRKSVSMDAKRAGDLVYVLGETRDELGGSEYYSTLGERGGKAPQVDTERNRALYERLAEAIDRGLVASCHDCSDGGLGAALAETAMAGELGMDVKLDAVEAEHTVIALFSESQGRFVVTVNEDDVSAIEDVLADSFCARIGVVTERPVLRIASDGVKLAELAVEQMKSAWQTPLRF